jgi:hypothetical protein
MMAAATGCRAATVPNSDMIVFLVVAPPRDRRHGGGPKHVSLPPCLKHCDRHVVPTRQSRRIRVGKAKMLPRTSLRNPLTAC